ncbi:unnamed protein product [Amoebophrya sp. A25]|nr:unnamed protein product [Amoebophrya sp. A25]|eukprot:GSA25T00015204001.1
MPTSSSSSSAGEGTGASRSLARLHREAKKLLADNSLETNGVEFDEQSIKDSASDDTAAAGDIRWVAYIQGPLLSIWRHGVFRVDIEFPKNYPFEAPRVKFHDPIFHPNVNPDDGYLCMRFLQDQWSPTYRIDSVLQVLRAMLADPNFSASDIGVETDMGRLMEQEDKARGSGNLPAKLFHYTNSQAIELIRASQLLKASASGARGPGVYTTCLPPTLVTQEQVVSNTSCKGADWVIELDVPALQGEGFAVNKCNQGYSIKGADHYLVTKGLKVSSTHGGLAQASYNSVGAGWGSGASCSDIQLTLRNSVILTFEQAKSCTPNMKAATLFQRTEYGTQRPKSAKQAQQDWAVYKAGVERSIELYGGHRSTAARQVISLGDRDSDFDNITADVAKFKKNFPDFGKNAGGQQVSSSTSTAGSGLLAKNAFKKFRFPWGQGSSQQAPGASSSSSAVGGTNPPHQHLAGTANVNPSAEFWDHVLYQDGALGLPHDLEKDDWKLSDVAELGSNVIKASAPRPRPRPTAKANANGVATASGSSSSGADEADKNNNNNNNNNDDDDDSESRSCDHTFTCAICFEPLDFDEDGNPPKADSIATLKGCKHVFHRTCIEEWFKQGKLACPICKHAVTGKVIGKGPRKGTMSWCASRTPCAGCTDIGGCDDPWCSPRHGKHGKNNKSKRAFSYYQSIAVTFDFPASKTDDQQPQRYDSRSETAWLPYNAEGLTLLELFKVAFRRRTMFGIGTRLTLQTFAPTFNIHIKTRPTGGATSHAYPDPAYFDNALGELETNGIDVLDLPQAWLAWFPQTPFGKPLIQKARVRRGLAVDKAAEKKDASSSAVPKSLAPSSTSSSSSSATGSKTGNAGRKNREAISPAPGGYSTYSASHNLGASSSMARAAPGGPFCTSASTFFPGTNYSSAGTGGTLQTQSPRKASTGGADPSASSSSVGGAATAAPSSSALAPPSTSNAGLGVNSKRAPVSPTPIEDGSSVGSPSSQASNAPVGNYTSVLTAGRTFAGTASATSQQNHQHPATKRRRSNDRGLPVSLSTTGGQTGSLPASPAFGAASSSTGAYGPLASSASYSTSHQLNAVAAVDGGGLAASLGGPTISSTGAHQGAFNPPTRTASTNVSAPAAGGAANTKARDVADVTRLSISDAELLLKYNNNDVQQALQDYFGDQRVIQSYKLMDQMDVDDQ